MNVGADEGEVWRKGGIGQRWLQKREMQRILGQNSGEARNTDLGVV